MGRSSSAMSWGCAIMFVPLRQSRGQGSELFVRYRPLRLGDLQVHVWRILKLILVLTFGYLDILVRYLVCLRDGKHSGSEMTNTFSAVRSITKFQKAPFKSTDFDSANFE
jgi:hypothetical protein